MQPADQRRSQAERTLVEALRAVANGDSRVGGPYRVIVENALQSMTLLTPDGIVLEANQQAQRSLGAARDDLAGVALWDAAAWLNMPDLRQRLRAAMAAAKRGVTVRQESELSTGSDAATVEISFSPIATAGGQVVLIVAEWRDVTDRKRSEAALRETEGRFQRIVSLAVDAIISMDETQRITLFNHGAERIFGYAADEVLGQPLELLLPRELGDLHAREVRAFGAGTEEARRMGQRRQILGRRKNGEIFNAEASISKARVAGRTIFTAVMRDVTERWVAEQEKNELLRVTEAARDVAERAVAQRDEMLGIVSHDLRNPLSAIAMCAGVLSDASTPGAERLRLSETIQESVEWCQRLIADLVDIASIETGKLSVERQPLDPVITVGRALSLFELSAAERSITLRPEGTEHLPSIDADPERLLQVLANLIANALKFTAPGGTVSVGAEANNGSVVFAVTDTGTGIPAEHIPHVFERRWRGAAKGTETSTGLGLAIAHGIVEAHGGRIWVDSTPGRGSRFQFSIPVPAK